MKMETWSPKAASLRVFPSLAALALLAAAGGAQAQQAIQPGQTVRGTLSAQDRKLDDGSHYRCYSLKTVADQLYVITLSSDDFDAYLSAGPGGDCEDLEESNDDGPNMGTNAQLSLLATGNRITIRANTLGSEETGAFRLAVSAGEAIRPTRDIMPLMLGSSVAGTLSHGDRRAEDGTFYDCYQFQMRSDDTVAIRMDANDFDAFLGLYQGEACSGVPLTTDDDSGGGTSAQIIERLRTGPYSVRANSVSSGTGSYSLSLTVRR